MMNIRLNYLARAFISILFVITCSPIIAQQTFNTHLGYANSNIYYMGAGPCVELPGNEYLITAHNNQSAMIIINVSESGEINWKKLFTSSNPYITDVLLSDSSIYFKHEITSQYSNSRIFKTDMNGNFIWGKSFSNGTGDDVRIWKMNQLSNGNLMCVGSSGRNLIGDTTNILILKLDVSGNLIWQKTCAINGYLKSRGLACTELSSGNLMIFGDCHTDFSLNNPEKGFSFSMKLSSTGELISCKAFNRIHNAFTSNHSFIKISENKFLAAGLIGPFSGQGLLFNSLDSNGISLAEWQYNFDFFPMDFALHSTSTITITGTENSQTTGLNILQLDSSGSVSWAKKFSPQKFYHIATTADGGFIASGNVTQYDNLQTLYSYVSLLKTNLAGDGACNSEEVPINPVKLNNVTFDSILSVNSSITTIFETDFFLDEDSSGIYKYDCTVGIEPPEQFNAQISVFPNPSNGIATITFNKNFDKSPNDIELFSIFGNKVFEEKNITELDCTINTELLPSGCYFLSIVNRNNSRITLPLIIE